MNRAYRLRQAKLRELQAKGVAELRPYLNGECEFIAMASAVDQCVDQLDRLLDHPSVVLDRARYALVHEARQSMTELRLGLVKAPRD